MTPTEKLISKQVLSILRTNTQDNLSEPPEDPEIQVAISLAVGEINATPPITNMSIDQMWAKSAYQFLLVMGTAKYVVSTLVADWTHNGMDATIDEFTLQNRLADYRSLLEDYNREFTERLSEVKPYMGRTVKVTNVMTPRVNPRGYGTTTSKVTPFPYTMFRSK